MKPRHVKRGSQKRQTGPVCPAFCPTCKGRGGVIDTRMAEGYIRRRHKCGRNHRWTSVEFGAPTRGQGVKIMDTVMDTLKKDSIRSVIGMLKGMLK